MLPQILYGFNPPLPNFAFREGFEGLAKRGNPWQDSRMGNKDTRHREKKKPKKEKPKVAPVSQAPRAFRPAPAPSSPAAEYKPEQK
jgi:hypothetical protein